MTQQEVINKVNTDFTRINSNFSYLNSVKPNMAIAYNSALPPSSGECTWNINHNLNTSNIICAVYKNGIEIVKNLTVNSNSSITIKFKASSAVPAKTLQAVIIGL